MLDDEQHQPADEREDIAAGGQPETLPPSPRDSMKARVRLAILTGMTVGASVAVAVSTCSPGTTSISIE